MLVRTKGIYKLGIQGAIGFKKKKKGIYKYVILKNAFLLKKILLVHYGALTEQMYKLGNNTLY